MCRLHRLHTTHPLLFFSSQLPIKVGHQNTHTKVSTDHNKECLINISKYKFSLVISGLTTILKNVNNMVSALLPPLCEEWTVQVLSCTPNMIIKMILFVNIDIRIITQLSCKVNELSTAFAFVVCYSTANIKISGGPLPW